ncbi:hypothetical protein ACM5Q9_05820 [Advenella sp. RU8]|uniref:hypothetical protein n=1 Tax=Advenella sp. RU8 TaxID=3399575 RepID=UPI003AB03B04
MAVTGKNHSNVLTDVPTVSKSGLPEFTVDGYEITGSTPDEFKQHISSEIQKWKVAVEKSGAKVQ